MVRFMDDLLQEFIAETRDTLESLASELLIWENEPHDKERLDSIFRFFHTIKGSCGFLNLPRFERLSHAAEEVLSDVRDGKRDLSVGLVDAILAVTDRIGDLIAVMESGEALPDQSDADLIHALSVIPQTANGERPSAAAPQPSAQIPELRDSVAKIRSIRIPLDLIDNLMNGVSDMVLARNEVSRCLRDVDNDPVLESAFDKLSSCIADLRDAIGQTRMQRIDRLFSPLPRVVRELSANLGKQVELETYGNSVELDREMLEMIRDPLTHIIRNSVDHGLETADVRRAAGKREVGKLSLSARQSGNQILIEIADDGQGINLDNLVARAVKAKVKTAAEAQNLSDKAKLELIFSPGFSTAETITAISGRGVGMDVVRSNIEQIGGSIDIENFPGQGLKITMRVPLTLTIMACLTVLAGGQQFAIPRSAVQEILFSDNRNVRKTTAGGIQSAYIRDVRLPHICLEDILGLEIASVDGTQRRTIITVSASSDLEYALEVSAVMDHEELVVRPGAPIIMADGIYAGTTLPDNGRPMLLLDPVGLAHRARLNVKRITDSADKNADNDNRDTDDSVAALLFRGLDKRLCAIPLGAMERVEDVPFDAISKIAGHVRVKMEDSNHLVYGLDTLPTSGTVKLLRLSDGHLHLRFAIEDVLDIVRLPAHIEPSTDHNVVAGIAQIGDQLVEVIDTHWIFANLGGDRLEKAMVQKPLCELSGSDDQWSRTILAPLIRSIGYDVTFAGDHAGHSARTEEMSRCPDIRVITEGDDDLATPNIVGADLAINPRSDDVICLTKDKPQPGDGAHPHRIHRYDRDALVSALQARRQHKAAS